MKKNIPAVLLGAACLLLAACTSSTFVASKDGKGYYVGHNSQAAYEMFCESGDLKKILAHAEKIGQDMKDELYRYNCGPERSNVKVKELFASMTSAQRKDLRQSFKLNGYEINIMRC